MKLAKLALMAEYHNFIDRQFCRVCGTLFYHSWKHACEDCHDKKPIPSKCNLCGMHFPSRTRLFAHLKSEHGEQ